MSDTLGEQDERQPDLKDAEISNDGPVRDRPRFFHNGWNADYCHHNTCNQNAGFGSSIFLRAERNHHHCRCHTAEHGENIAIETSWAELVTEAQERTQKNDDHRNPVGARTLYTQEPISKPHHIYGSGIL